MTLLTGSLGNYSNPTGRKRVWESWLKAGEAAASHHQFTLPWNCLLTEAGAQPRVVWAEGLRVDGIMFRYNALFPAILFTVT